MAHYAQYLNVYALTVILLQHLKQHPSMNFLSLSPEVSVLNSLDKFSVSLSKKVSSMNITCFGSLLYPQHLEHFLEYGKFFKSICGLKNEYIKIMQ